MVIGRPQKEIKLKSLNNGCLILSSNMGPRELGRKFNVAHSTIIRIRSGYKWRGIQNV